MERIAKSLFHSINENRRKNVDSAYKKNPIFSNAHSIFNVSYWLPLLFEFKAKRFERILCIKMWINIDCGNWKTYAFNEVLLKSIFILLWQSRILMENYLFQCSGFTDEWVCGQKVNKDLLKQILWKWKCEWTEWLV